MLPRSFRAVLLTSVLLAPASTYAGDNDELATRVSELEKRLAALEKAREPLLAKAADEQRRKTQQQLARKRMRQDAERYSQEELRELEALYQVANKRWKTKQAQDNLRELVAKYDKANRTGSAIFYRGQMTREEKEKFLH